MDFTSKCSGCELIALASSTAILLAENHTSEEIGILSGFFSALGDNLALLAATPISPPKKD